MTINMKAESAETTLDEEQRKSEGQRVGEEEATAGEREDAEDTRPQRRKSKRRVPLSVPPGKPSRLIEMEEKVIAAVRALFDDVEAMDQSIEEVGQAITDLMSNRVQE